MNKKRSKSPQKGGLVGWPPTPPKEKKEKKDKTKKVSLQEKPPKSCTIL